VLQSYCRHPCACLDKGACAGLGIGEPLLTRTAQRCSQLILQDRGELAGLAPDGVGVGWADQAAHRGVADKPAEGHHLVEVAKALRQRFALRLAQR